MVTRYVGDVGHWEEWQVGYRSGILLVVPPDPPLSAVNALRAEHDPRSHAICQAHVTLTVPLPRPLTEARWRELESAVAGVRPFTVRYGPAVSFPPHPGVCLAIEPQATLDALRAALEATPAFENAAPRPYPFRAHMTIAEFIEPAETRPLIEAVDALGLVGEFPCADVCLAVPDEDFRFTVRRRLSLVGGVEPTD